MPCEQQVEPARDHFGRDNPQQVVAGCPEIACCLQALNNGRGTTGKLQALQTALLSTAIPAAQLSANVALAICCHACDAGDQ